VGFARGVVALALTFGGSLLPLAESASAATGLNGKLSVTPNTGLTPGGSLPAAGPATGTPTVSISVVGVTGFWEIGTCLGEGGRNYPPLMVRDCNFEGWFGSGVSGTLLPYVCGQGVIQAPGATPVAGPGGRVALALVQPPFDILGTTPLLDYVELSYNCGAPVSVSVPGGTATLSSSDGTVGNATSSPVPSTPPSPAGVGFPFGLIGFDVTGLSAGETVTVTVTLPAPVSDYWKLQNGVWYQPTGTTFAGNQVILTLTDGGTGDSDGVANGVIVDPGAPAIAATLVTKDQCKNGGWRAMTDGHGQPFRNQGQCVSYLNGRR
jgi:hypothetical protein